MPEPIMHSKVFQCSKAHRWLNCFLSAKFNDQSGTIDNPRTLFGTESHSIGAALILESLNLKDYEETKSSSELIKEATMYDDEMKEITEGYASFVVGIYEAEKRRIGHDPFITVEQHLDLDIDEDAGGTMDCGIIAGDTLIVIDLKTGFTPVSSGPTENCPFNEQLGLYGYGFYQTYKDIYSEIKKVRLVVYQPTCKNTNEFETTVDEIIKFRNELIMPAVKKINELSDEANPGDYCRYCPINARCSKRAEILKVVESKKDKTLLSNEEIEAILPKLDEIIDYVTDLKDYCLKKAISGHKWSGYKLVVSKVSRKISDEKAVIKICEQEGVDPYANKKLAGITELTKRLGKDKFKEKINPYITIQEGSYVLVPNSDSREEINVNTEEKNNEI